MVTGELSGATSGEREMAKRKRVLIVGGDAAGMSAASQLRRMADPGDVEIVAFERGPRTSYARCGLPYLLERLVESHDDLIARTPAEFAQRHIDARVHHEVTSIDTEARTMVVRNLDSGTEVTEEWDECVLATGATGVKPPIEGIDTPGVFQLRTIEESAALDRWIAEGARTAVVVGAGYIGVEVTEALLERGLSVTTVDAAGAVMGGAFDSDIGALVGERMRRAGVDLRLGAAVEGFLGDSGRLRSVVVGGEEIPADLAVFGLGVRPNTALAEAAGIALGEHGGIVVDDHMRTPVDGVWSAGDCVESTHRITGDKVVIALGTHANKQGRVCGTNLGGGDVTFPGVIGTAITRFGDLEIARSGLSESEAQRVGTSVVTSTSSTQTRAGYYPGASGITTKLVVRKSDGVLLGAQIVGGEGAGKRIDALATAIWASMTVGDLAMADLSYAPPFSPVFDPVVLAAGIATTRWDEARRKSPRER